MPDEKKKDITQASIYEILAKPDESLIQHMTNVGVLAHVMLTQSVLHTALVKLTELTNGSEKDTLDFLTYIFAMHDIGKVHPEFQKNIRNPNKHAGSFRHEVYGARVLRKMLKSKGMNSRMALLVAEIIKNHHQKDELGENPNDEEYWSKIQYDNEKIISEHFPFDINITVKKECENKFGHLALGCLICCDWLASGDLVFKNMPSIHNYENYFNTAKVRAEDFVMRSGLENKKLPYASFEKMFPFIKKPTPVQKIILEHRGNTLFQIIESPMGSGKSEAAFYAAFHTGYPCSGIIECMPTNATAATMQPRMNAMMHNLGLGASFRVGGLQKIGIPEKEPENLWETVRAMKLSAPYIIGTIDQMLRCVRAVRYSDLMLAFVQSHAVILDEVHSYDPLTVNIIETFLKFAKAYKIPVIMMTATLPDSLKKHFMNIYSNDFSVSRHYPLIMSFDADIKKFIEESPEEKPENYEIVFEQIHGIYDNCNKIAEKALALVKEGGCCSVVLNTVERAVRTAHELKKRNSDAEVFLVHGRMTKKQKDKKVKEIVSIVGSSKDARRHRPKKAVFVSTQIIELSVDADFDFMLSDLAPVDTLFQRIGRLWRSPKPGTIRDSLPVKRKLLVLVPDDSHKTHGPYQENIMQNTLNTMKKKYLIPSEIKSALNTVYTESIVKELLDEESLEAEIGCQSIRDGKFELNKKALSKSNRNVRESQKTSQKTSKKTWKIAFADEDKVAKAERNLNEAMSFMENFVVSVAEKEKPEGKKLKGYLNEIILADKNGQFCFDDFYGCYKKEWLNERQKYDFFSKKKSEKTV